MPGQSLVTWILEIMFLKSSTLFHVNRLITVCGIVFIIIIIIVMIIDVFDVLWPFCMHIVG